MEGQNLGAGTPSTEQPLSFGERLVGIKFNPSNDDNVHAIKTKFAELANLCLQVSPSGGMVADVVFNTAMQQVLLAQMYCVKLVTLKY